MNHIELKLGDEVIPFEWGVDCQDSIARRLLGLDADRFLIVTDKSVLPLYSLPLADRLLESAPTLVLTAEPGEGGKTLQALALHAEQALAWGVTRRSVVVTVGGGVPGNLGGLLAALLFRGMRLVHVPTTLMGQVDSVISLKQAINSRSGKNLIGTYYQPELILADLRSLVSLPPREIRSGLCELIKNGLAIRPGSISRLLEILDPKASYTTEIYGELLIEAIETKLEVMESDPFERGRALILEYGHTVGHAIELADYEARGANGLSHGEAIGLGMLAAADLGGQFGNLSEADICLHHELLERAGVSRSVPADLDPKSVIKFLKYDNKRGYGQPRFDSVDMILLDSLGRPLGDPDRPLTTVPWNSLQRALMKLWDDPQSFNLPCPGADEQGIADRKAISRNAFHQYKSPDYRTLRETRLIPKSTAPQPQRDEE